MSEDEKGVKNILEELKTLFSANTVKLNEEQKTVINDYTETRTSQIGALCTEYMRDTLQKALSVNSVKEQVIDQLTAKLSEMTPMMLMDALEKISTASTDTFKAIFDVLKKSEEFKKGVVFANTVNVQQNTVNSGLDKETVGLLQNLSDIYHIMNINKTTPVGIDHECEPDRPE